MTPHLFQLELSSRCNLACVYCVNRIMARPHQDMEPETFEHVLAWLKAGPEPKELNLAGIGESTLNPHFCGYVEQLRALLPRTRFVLASNGIGVTREVAQACRRGQVVVFVSLHHPDRAQEGVEFFLEAGCLAAVTKDPVRHANDWAGQVAWKKPDYRMPCQFLHDGKLFVASNGAILTCCLDATGESRLGSVFDSPEWALNPARWRLCDGCYQDPPSSTG